MDSRVSLVVVPDREVLVDESVSVLLEGLQGACDVTLVSLIRQEEKVKDKDKEFISHAHYTSDDRGIVDVQQQPSLGGSYTGVEPMGFIWSMKPADGGRQDIRLIHVNMDIPQVIQLYILAGHVTVKSSAALSHHQCLARATLERLYKHRKVEQLTIREGNLRGVLYIPQGSGPFPAVIDMFGGDGGLKTFRAALLASRGILSLALAYFRYDDLPETNILNYEYFKEAIDWLASHPLTCKDSGGIGVVGVSLGGAVTMIMSTLSHKVKAVVSINGHSTRLNGTHINNGEKLTNASPTSTEWRATPEGHDLCEVFRPNEEYRPLVFPIETAAEDCEFLFILGEDDRSVHPDHTRYLVDRIRIHGRQAYRLLSYLGAGHLIEPPHAPLCRACHTLMISGTMLYGGEPKQHARAQEQSWPEILSFLHRRLNPRCQNNKENTYITRPVNSRPKL